MIAPARLTDAKHQAISKRDIGRIAFAAAHIHQPGITQHEIGGGMPSSNRNASLQIVHNNKSPPDRTGSFSWIVFFICCYTWYQIPRQSSRVLPNIYLKFDVQWSASPSANGECGAKISVSV